jgi:hypothetical protein
MAFTAIYRILNIPIQIFTYTISFWQLFLFGILASMLIAFLMKLFD